MTSAKMKFFNLEKITITSLFLIPFIIIAVGVVFIVTLEGVLYNNVRESIQTVGFQAAQLADERLQTIRARLSAVSYINDITSKNIELNDKIDVLRTEMDKHGWKDMFFANLDGYGKTVTGAAFSIADRSYFHEVVKGASKISNIVERKGYDRDYIAHSVPIISPEKEIIGVLVAVEDGANPRFAYSGSIKNPLATEVFFVDEHGRFVDGKGVAEKSIYRQIAEENDYSPEQASMHLLRQLSDEKKSVRFKGVDSFISVNPIGNTGWSTVGVVSRDAAMQRIDNVWYFSIILMIGILFVLIFCIVYLFKMAKVYKQYSVFSSAVIDAQGIFYLNIDAHGIVHFANAHFYNHLGCEETDKDLQLLHYMDDVDAHDLHALLHSGKNFTLHLHPKAAEPFHMQCTVIPHQERKGLWILLGTDISAYQSALEARVAKSRSDELQQIINSIPHAIMVHTKESGVRFANKVSLELLGVETMADVGVGILRGMDSETYAHQQRMIQQVFETGVSENSVFNFKPANGDEIVCHNIQSPVFDDEGNVIYAVNVSIDITETLNLQNKLKDELKRLHEILDSSPTGFLYTCERVVMYCNPAIYKMTGVEVGKEVNYDHLDLLDIGRDYRDHVENGGNVSDVLAVVPAGNGQKRYLRISALGTRWFGKWHSMVWAHDVTDIENAQKELIVARDAAEQAARAKSDFLATMSHEIRTPMNAVLGFLHVFKKDNLDSVQLNYIDKITISAKGLLRIINDILDFSKVEANKLDLENAPFNLIANIDAVYSIMSFSAQEKDLSFHRSIDDDVPCMIMGDGDRLNQVLLNLLSNAIKFTTEGAISLHIGVVEKINAQQYLLRFSVSDTGIGLSEDQISMLFRPFTQADASTSRKFGGTGLGLAISKRLVELMGGSIEVHSELGKGATFVCTIPATVAMETLLPYGREGEVNLADIDIEDIELLKGKQVLIAEDNFINQEIAAAMLEEYGMHLEFANNGQEAVDKVQQKHYDLIFMDLQMPVMNGLDATRTIRSLGEQLPHLKDMPIIAMTANVMNEDRQSCQDVGMNDHVGKPIEPEALRAALVKWLL